MEQLRDQGLDLDVPRLWVIDGSKALTSAINSLCGQAAKMQRCQIHKISKVTERLPKDMREQVAWRMKAAFGLQAVKGIGHLKALAQELKALSTLMLRSACWRGLGADVHCGHAGRARDSGMQLEQPQQPNSVVCRRSQRGDTLPQCRYGAALDGDRLLGKRTRLRPIKGFAQLPDLIRALCPQQEQCLAAS